MPVRANFGSSPNDIVASIYEHCTSDSPWVEALDMLRCAMGANVATFRMSQTGGNPRQVLFAAGPMVSAEALGEWQDLSPRDLLPVQLAAGQGCVVDWAKFERTREVADLLLRYRVKSMAVECIGQFAGAECTLTCARGPADQDFTDKDLPLLGTISDHLRRGLRLRQEILSARVERQFQADALDQLGIAAILVSASGDYTLLNNTARSAVRNGIGLRVLRNRIHTVEESEDGKFRQALEGALSSRNHRGSRAMLIDGGKGLPRIHVVITGRSSLSLISNRVETCALIFARTAQPVTSSDTALLRQLFSFTKREATLAIHLAKGMRMEDVESELNIRHNTARAHLRSMFLKADVNRQAELVCLLANSIVPLGRETVERVQ